MRSFIALVSLCLSLALPSQAQEQFGSASVLILDASGSMWAQLEEGRSRIEVARDVLDDFLGTRPAEAPLGVIAYGHNRRGDCSDIAVIAPFGTQDATSLAARLRALSPRGKTPIADALRLAASQVPATAEDADIVLVTDGLETCGGDPCAVAAELARAGIPMRAHVVGFGLTEGEVAQIACVAEQTGGMVLSTQSGEELADALVRTTTAQTVEPISGMAKINLTIDADIAGRPDRVAFRGVNEAMNTSVEFGTLDFGASTALPVDLAEGDWFLTADAGEFGNGELAVTVQAGDTRTIYIPFFGLMPKLELTPPIGGMRAGASGIFPHTITREGLASGGADFVLTLLPTDATTLDDRALTWSMQQATLGSDIARLNLPAETGTYRVAYHRYGETDMAKALKLFDLEVVTRPDVALVAPEAVEPGAVVPVTVTGGLAHADRLEIWKDGQLYSWDQSRYMEQLFESRYGPASPLMAPAEAGDYELVYVFSDIDGPESVAARQPLRVGDATFIDASAAPAREPRCDDDTGCGMGEDAGVGVVPASFSTDDPQGRAVEWFVQPIEVANGQAVGSGGPVSGAWETALDAGLWAVTGIADGATYFRQIEVMAGGTLDFVLSADAPIDAPAEMAQPAYAFVCEEDFQCIYEEPTVGILTILPSGWAVDQPIRASMTAGGQGGPVRLTFTDTADPSQWMVLNPHQWVEANGPCIDVQAGQLCHVADASDTTLTALDFLRRSLRDTAPRQSPDPATALAEAMSSLAGDDPAAAEAMGALLGAAQGAEGGPDLGAILEGAMGGMAAQDAPLPTPDAALSNDDFDALRRQLTGN